MALDDLIKEATRSLAAQLNEALESLSDDLSRAAADDRTAAVARATETLKAELAAAKAATRAEVDRAVAAEVEKMRAEVEDAALARIEAMRAEAQKAADARVDAAHTQARQAAEAEIARARADAQESIEVERARVAQTDEQTKTQAVADALAGERQGHLACVEHLLFTVRALDEGKSLTDVLGALLAGAAREAPRVGILLLQGSRLRGWRFTGFEPDPGGVDLEIAQAGVIGRAVRTRAVAFAEPSAPGQTFPPGPGFATLPPDRSGFAVPLVVGHTPVAVLYADDASETAQMKPASWPEAIELMARHASVCLENLTAVRTAQALGMSPRAREAAPKGAGGPGAATGAGDDEDGGARRYARLLVSEIRLYNEAAVRIGRQKRDLLERLRPEIDRARRLYEERVPATVRARHEYFNDELLQTLADGDASVLGRRSDALA